MKELKIDDRLSTNDVKKVYDKLIGVARKGKNSIIHYDEIMLIAGLDRENAHDRETVLGRMLGGISQHEMDCDRPPLSAIVVLKLKPQVPGKGFFGFNDTKLSDYEYWIKKINEVWKHWSK